MQNVPWWPISLAFAEVSQPFGRIFKRSFVLECKYDEYMFLEIFVRVKHVANNVSCQPMLVGRAHSAPDNPKELCDLFLSRCHLAILLQPDWKRDSQVKETWSICQCYLFSCPLHLLSSCPLSAAFGLSARRESFCLRES